jgi:hypothetical protein
MKPAINKATPGDVRLYKGQAYRCVGPEIYVNRKGRSVDVNKWLSRCPDCGTYFEFLHQARGEFKPVRRCQEHKSRKKVRAPKAWLSNA